MWGEKKRGNFGGLDNKEAFPSLQNNYHYNLNGVRVIAVCPGLLESEDMTKGNKFKSVEHEKAWQMDIQGMKPQK